MPGSCYGAKNKISHLIDADTFPVFALFMDGAPTKAFPSSNIFLKYLMIT